MIEAPEEKFLQAVPLRGAGGGGKAGGGGGSGAHEDADTLISKSYARVIDLLCEGPIQGFKHPDRPLADIILDGTPIENSDTATYTSDGSCTLNSPNFHSNARLFRKEDKGRYVISDHFPPYTAVKDILNPDNNGQSHSVTLTQNATASGSGLTWTMGGSRNWKNFWYYYRPGTPNQGPIPGFPAAESVTAVGVQVKKNFPVTRSISDDQVDACIVSIKLPRLEKQDTTNGDLHGTHVRIQIWLVVNGVSWYKIEDDDIKGKSSNGYIRSYRIELSDWPVKNTDGSTKPFDIQVQRITKDSTSQALMNDTWWDSYTTIVYGKLMYPNSVVVATKFDASQFGAIPVRGFHMLGLLIKVPINYDPIARTYTGTWNGTFKTAWTDNPAWCWFAMATQPRWGLGSFVNVNDIDKWTLYEIGKYCDEMVPTGFGGTEPRFTCNLYMQQANDAYKVLADMMGICRGMVTYWNGVLMPVQDKLETATEYRMFTPANVIGGQFNYSGTGIKARHNACKVSWNDLKDNGNLKEEYVEDTDQIRESGSINLLEIVGFGCSSRGQARRWAKGAVYMEKILTDTVTFQTALEGFFITPGQIIKIQDPFRAGAVLGGRILAVDTSGTNTVLTVDRPVDGRVFFDASFITGGTQVTSPTAAFVADDVGRIIGATGLAWPTRIAAVINGSTVTIDTPAVTGHSNVPCYIGWKQGVSYQVSTFSPTDGSTQTIGAYQYSYNVASGDNIIQCADFPVVPENESVFMVTQPDVLEPALFRVIGVSAKDQNIVDVTALEYNESLYNFIDFNEPLEEPPISTLPPPDQVLPASNMRFTEVVRYVRGRAELDLDVSWNQSPDPHLANYIVGYREGRVDDDGEIGWGNWRFLQQNLNTLATIPNVKTNYAYDVLVYAMNVLGRLSPPLEGFHGVDAFLPPNIVGLEISGQANNPFFNTVDVTFDWRVAGQQGPQEPIGGGVMVNGMLITPNYAVRFWLPDGTALTEVHIIPDQHYTFTLVENLTAMRVLYGQNALPAPLFWIEVRAVNEWGEVGHPAYLQVRNLVPDRPTAAQVITLEQGVAVEWDNITDEPDLLTTLVYYNTVPLDQGATYIGSTSYPGRYYVAQVDNSATLYWWVAHMDWYGQESTKRFAGASWPAGQLRPVRIIPPTGYAPSGQEVTLVTVEQGAQIMYSQHVGGQGGWTRYNPAAKPTITAANNWMFAYAQKGGYKSVVEFALYVIGTGCITPSFDHLNGTYEANERVQQQLMVTVQTLTAGAQMRWTIGTVAAPPPDPTPTTGNLINGSSGILHIPTGDDQVIKIIAYKAGIADSYINTLTVTVIPWGTPPPVPDFSPGGGHYANTDYPIPVHITDDDLDAIIWYSIDGRQPYIRLDAPPRNVVFIREPGITLRARAESRGGFRSATRSDLYDLLAPPDKPRFNPPEGSFPTFPLSVTISAPAPALRAAGTQIRWTNNGSTPTASQGTLIAGSSGVITVQAGQTIKAVAFNDAQGVSEVATAVYTQLTKVAAPTFVVTQSQNVTLPNRVTINCATVGATIMFTTDGTTPTQQHGTKVTDGWNVNVASGTPVNAMAYKAGMVDSDLATITPGGLPLAATPTITPNGGAFDTSPQSVQLASTTPASTIVYTLDGSPPTRTNGTQVPSGAFVSVDFDWAGKRLRTIAFAAGYSDSIDTQAFFELNQVPAT